MSNAAIRMCTTGHLLFLISSHLDLLQYFLPTTPPSAQRNRIRAGCIAAAAAASACSRLRTPSHLLQQTKTRYLLREHIAGRRVCVGVTSHTREERSLTKVTNKNVLKPILCGVLFLCVNFVFAAGRLCLEIDN